MKYEIRPAFPEEAPAIAALLAQVGLLAEGVDYTEFSPPVLVAVGDAGLIGVCSALLGRPMAHIMELAVVPEARQHGVATSLVHCMETIFRVTGCRAWCAHVRVDRELNDYLKGWPGAYDAGEGKGWVRVL